MGEGARDPSDWTGQQIRLRAMRPDDARHFYEWNLDTEMPRGLDKVWFPTSELDVERWAREETTLNRKQDEFRFVIESLDGQFLGNISTHRCNPRVGNFFHGVAVKKGLQRRGVASEAIRLVQRYYFHELRYQRVSAEVYGFNTASIKLHEKLGFVMEGRVRRGSFTRGEHHDVLLFGQLREEFDALVGEEAR